MKIVKKLFIAAIFLALFSAEAYPVSMPLKGHDTTIVKLKLNMITELEFPETISNVTKGIPAESLQVETLGKRMFLMARDMLDTHIYVVTHDNVSYCLHLAIDDAMALPHVDIKKPVLSQAGDEKNKDASNTIELMKNLMAGKTIDSASSLVPLKEEIFNDKRFRIVIDEAYEFPGRMKAFILTFENLTGKPVVIPVEHIELPGLLAISVENQMLEARSTDGDKKTSISKTKAYLVVEDTR